MFVRGSGSGQEYKRVDIKPYRGIVVKTNDPLGLNRVKVYIPELSNQPFDSWFEQYDQIHVKGIGENLKTLWNDKETNGDWTDVDIFEEIAQAIPWAEQCSPIVGESNNFRFYKEGKLCIISDCNYVEGFSTTEIPTLSSGSFSPAFLYENFGTRLGDAFSNPISNLSVKCNPYSFLYAPSKHVNKGKGLFGVPEVGSKVWVFHYEGDSNYPVYFGKYHDYRELSLIDDTDNENKLGIKKSIDFDS